MPRQPPRQNPTRIGLAGRATAWLVVFALLVECAVSAGAALGMWVEAHASSDTTAQALCPEHGFSGKPDGSSDHHKRYDHEHCLLCNTAVGDCPAPILPQLFVALQGAVVPTVAPAIPAYRKVFDANAARGPPGPS